MQEILHRLHRWHRRPPASEAAIRQVEALFCVPPPPSYRALLQSSDGGEVDFGEANFELWPVEWVLERQQRPWAVYLPGTLAFASDGGDEYYFFDLRWPPDADGEYPILVADPGFAWWESTAVASWSLPALLWLGPRPLFPNGGIDGKREAGHHLDPLRSQPVVWPAGGGSEPGTQWGRTWGGSSSR